MEASFTSTSAFDQQPLTSTTSPPATGSAGRLALYGSALRGDFGPTSDIDILVEFHPGRTPGLLNLAQMELELEGLVGRQVELRTMKILAGSSATPSPRPHVLCMRPEDLVRLRHLTEAATKAVA